MTANANGGDESSGGPGVWQLQVTASHCRVDVGVNGIPVVDVDGDPDGVASLPINAYLVGADNDLAVTVDGVDRGAENGPGSGVDGADSRLHLTVTEYAPGEIAAPDAGDPVVEIDEESLGDAGASFPHTVRESFDSPGAPSFRDRLVDRPVVEEGRVRAFADRIGDAIGDGDLAWLLEAFRPAQEDQIRALAAAQGQDPEAMLANRESIATGQFEAFVEAGADRAIDADAVVATPLNDGRLWLVERAPGEALLHASVEEADGSTTVMELGVIVGEGPDGELRVVR